MELAALLRSAGPRPHRVRPRKGKGKMLSVGLAFGSGRRVHGIQVSTMYSVLLAACRPRGGVFGEAVADMGRYHARVGANTQAIVGTPRWMLIARSKGDELEAMEWDWELKRNNVSLAATSFACCDVEALLPSLAASSG